MDKIDKTLLKEIAGLHEIPQGSFNIRKNGESLARNSMKDIEILPKADKSGLDVFVKAGVKNKSVHLPVIITVGGLEETVYNDFHIGEGAEVTIVAGCGIYNCGPVDSVHDGVHRFYVGKGAKIRYIEKHYGFGQGRGAKILNPVTDGTIACVTMYLRLLLRVCREKNLKIM